MLVGLVAFGVMRPVNANGAVVSADLWAKMRAAGERQIGSGRFEGSEVYFRSERPMPDDDVDAQVAEMEQALRHSVRDGTLRLTEDRQRAMRNMFGTSDIRAVMSSPRATAWLEAYVKERTATFRKSLLIGNASQSQSSTVKYVVLSNQGIRATREYSGATFRGAADVSFEGRVDTQVVNREYDKTLVLAANGGGAGGGVVRPGMGTSPAAYTASMKHASLLGAGLPWDAKAWSLDCVKSVQTVPTPEGPGLRIVIVNEGRPGTGDCVVVSVCPGKDFSVCKREHYRNGKLSTIEEFGEYKNIAGRWYPMHQKRIGVVAELPADIAEKLATGAIGVNDEAVFRSQRILRSWSVERVLEDAQLGVPVEGAELALEFPHGTIVHDFVLGSGSQALEYTVGMSEGQIRSVDKTVGEMPLSDMSEPSNSGQTGTEHPRELRDRTTTEVSNDVPPDQSTTRSPWLAVAWVFPALCLILALGSARALLNRRARRRECEDAADLDDI